ncbi:MAG: glycine cleavage system aminomethyltransferase GcvT [Hyphomicrobiaceae bacterium]
MSANSPTTESARLQRTPLHDRHLALRAKMVPFAGYEMPVQYPLGILKEHLWTREHAGLFDVSHMGQAILIAADARHETVSAAIEALVPAEILNLAPGQQRYTQLLTGDGGILDDLMVTRPSEPAHAGGLVLIVNASRKDADFAHIEARLPSGVRLERRPDNALLALQGPQASDIIAGVLPDAADLKFMMTCLLHRDSADYLVSRSGYTGEDGFEIAVLKDHAPALWQRLLEDDRVRPIGLGARDTLRLEAGLCLYGHDIDETISPIEAGLAWSIQKRRRVDAGFPGADRILRELKEGPARRRVGILPEGRAPAREGTDILSESGRPIGKVTSGGFGPSVNGPIAMGYVASDHADVDTPVQLLVRGKALPARVVTLPFVPHRYLRKA